VATISVIADVPPMLDATEPPEARGLRRDAVRLLVSDVTSDSVAHATFADLPRYLSPGDLIVVNTSGTLNAALHATTERGERVELHLSTQLPGGFWTVEIRMPGPRASLPLHQAFAGTTLTLAAGATAHILAPYPLRESVDAASRLWLAAVQTPLPLPTYLAAHGFPIRYSYLNGEWPSEMYQTVFATEAGSAEMPSASRPFTPELVTRLVSAGVQIAPLLLHTGVASLEDHEAPYEEFYRVSRQTAERINAARRAGHRVVAAGTTVVRAIETVADEEGIAAAGRGWTDLVISPERPLRIVNALLSGLHEPQATHLMILEEAIRAAAGDRGSSMPVQQLDRAYAEARRRGYLWHEFGDSHLIVGATHSDPPVSRRTL
jgi:S-adenosylmethionine:tRNA ribosyltransferase-isomerase